MIELPLSLFTCPNINILCMSVCPYASARENYSIEFHQTRNDIKTRPIIDTLRLQHPMVASQKWNYEPAPTLRHPTKDDLLFIYRP